MTEGFHISEIAKLKKMNIQMYRINFKDDQE